MHALARLFVPVALVAMTCAFARGEHHGLFHKAPVQPITPPLLTADSPPPVVPPIVQMHADWPGYGLPATPPPPLRPECAPIGAVAFGGIGHHGRGQNKDCPPTPACQPNGGCGPMGGPAGALMNGPGAIASASFGRPSQLHPD